MCTGWEGIPEGLAYVGRIVYVPMLSANNNLYNSRYKMYLIEGASTEIDDKQYIRSQTNKPASARPIVRPSYLDLSYVDFTMIILRFS